MKGKSLDPCSDKGRFDQVKTSDIAAQKEKASRRSDAKMEEMMKRVGIVMKQTTETVLQSVNSQINGINSTINEMKEGDSKFGRRT